MEAYFNIAVAIAAFFGALPEAYRGFKWLKGKLSDKVNSVKS